MDPKNDHTVVVIKGKRTKRSRQSLSVNTASSCSSGGRGCGGGGGSEISICTDDDEDVANCLILLAQSGHERNTTINGRSNIQIECYGDQNIVTSSDRSSIQIEGVRICTPQIDADEAKSKLRKFSSKRFCEEATPINDRKAGVHVVYECKTCNRTFSSFQALGGHRASHRKAWLTTTGDEASPPPSHPPPSNKSIGMHKKEKKQLSQLRYTTEKQTFCHVPSKIGPPTNVTELSRIFRQNNEKVHECSICGAEFPSGQALGGHMRKHRNIPSNITKFSSNNTRESSEIDNDDGGERSRNILELDLNLPAPSEDHRDSQFSLLSFPALVDCQY